MKDEQSLREAICEVGRRMYKRDLVAATDGNISVRLEARRYLCTPSGVSKGFMSPADIIVADHKGKKLEGEGMVTSEFFTHLAAYEEREDIGAVVHAHPMKATGFTLSGTPLDVSVMPELLLTIGGIPTVPYAAPASREGGEAIRSVIGRCDALMLERHGSVTVGKDVFEAYLKLEKVEHAAGTLLAARLLGGYEELPEAQVEQLYAIQKVYGGGARLFRRR
jgi:L-fuculose-phosphate aldolase